MPSIKVLENNKNGSPETFPISIESGGSDGISCIKESQQSQTINNSSVTNNGSNKDQPANPLQQIVLIIEHKIRNLEKRKNKLESYKVIEKSGKRLTSDQKIAVSKYDECLASLELTRELCKQFQSIAAVANREAKKEAKRSAFVRAQQENAKVREVLIIQDVLKRLCTDTVRRDFLNGENGACKVSNDDLLILEKMFEVVQPKRPENTAEPTFVAAIKQAADHLSAIVDGRSKAFNESNYGSIKNVIDEIQSCGYFEKDLVVIEDETEAYKDSNDNSNETVEASDEGFNNDISSKEDAEDSNHSVYAEPEISMTNSNVKSSSCEFVEAPAATSVPSPSFPIQQTTVRPNTSALTIPAGAPSMITATIPHSTSTIGVNCVNVSSNAAHSQNAAPIIPTGPVTVPPLHSVPQQIGATTVQAVEHAYFKQHYIQQQLRPIHEVIGTANFYFLQESEIDKPDIVAPPVRFENNPAVTNDSTASKPVAQQQMLHRPSQMNPNHSNNPTNAQQNNQQTIVAKNSTAHHQPATGTLQSSTFNNKSFVAGCSGNFNHLHPLQSQSIEQKQVDHSTSGKQHAPVLPVMVSKTNELNHIPAFTSCNTTVVSTETVLPNAQTIHSMQPQQQQSQSLQNHAQVQRHPEQKVLLNQTVGNANQSSSILNASFNPSIQQFPSLIQGMQDSTNSVGKNIPQQLVVEPQTEKLKSARKLSEQSKQRDGWNSGPDFTTKLPNPDDKWPSNPSLINTISDNSSLEKNQFGLSRQSHHQKSLTASNNNNNNCNSPGITGITNRLDQNGSTTTSYAPNSNIQDANAAHPQPPLNQTGNRNTRSASNSQFHQNNGSSARFTSDNGANNPTPTFFKNNERYYQQNPSSTFGSNKTDSSFHQRSSTFKSRPESNGSGTARSSGFGSIGASNHAAGTNNNNNGIVPSSVDYRSNARPVNSTRNTGPPTSNARSQRNHSGSGNYGGPRGVTTSNNRGQSTLNA